MFLTPASTQRAASNGPLLVFLNPASGHKDTDKERQVLAEVFNTARWTFEFLQFDKTAGIADVCAKAVALDTGKCGSCGPQRLGDAEYTDRFTFRKLKVALRGKRRVEVLVPGPANRTEVA